MAPGLLDFSAEEIRFEAYKANAEGKADTYVSIWRVLIFDKQLTLVILQMCPSRTECFLSMSTLERSSIKVAKPGFSPNFEVEGEWNWVAVRAM